MVIAEACFRLEFQDLLSEYGSRFARMPISQNRDMGHPATQDTGVVSLTSFAVLVLEIDPEEEVDHASGVGRRGEAEEGVLDGGVLRAKEDGLEVGFVEGVVEVGLEANGCFVSEYAEAWARAALRSVSR
jgi:hypothetical protein